MTTSVTWIAIYLYYSFKPVTHFQTFHYMYQPLAVRSFIFVVGLQRHQYINACDTVSSICLTKINYRVIFHERGPYFSDIFQNYFAHFVLFYFDLLFIYNDGWNLMRNYDFFIFRRDISWHNFTSIFLILLKTFTKQFDFMIFWL